MHKKAFAADRGKKRRPLKVSVMPKERNGMYE
jgi:hypothetical protein